MAQIIARWSSQDLPSTIPPWCKVYIVRHQGSRYVYVMSRIHKNRKLRCGVSYGNTFNRPISRDSDFLKFISRFW